MTGAQTIAVDEHVAEVNATLSSAAVDMQPIKTSDVCKFGCSTFKRYKHEQATDLNNGCQH